MALRRMGWVVAVAVPLVLGSLVAGSWTPPVRAISTPGATPVKAESAPSWVSGAGFLAPPPTTSLREVRCKVWRARSGTTCPDDSVLAPQLWPGLSQANHTLYVAMWSGLFRLTDSPPSLNVDYQPSSRTVTIHRSVSLPLLVWRSSNDQRDHAALAATLNLLVVHVGGVPAGVVTVVTDDWVERITGDERGGEATLGTVELS
jgi:hypothetical protein